MFKSWVVNEYSNVLIGPHDSMTVFVLHSFLVSYSTNCIETIFPCAFRQSCICLHHFTVRDGLSSVSFFFFPAQLSFFSPQTNHKKVTLYAARWSGQIKKPEKRVNKSWTILNMYHIIQLVTRHIYLVMKQILATLNYLCNICGVIFLAYLQGISLTFLTVLLASVRRYHNNIVDFFF